MMFKRSSVVIGMLCIFVLVAVATIPYVKSRSNHHESNPSKTSPPSYLRGTAHDIGIVSVPYGGFRMDDTEVQYPDTVYIISYNPFNQTESDWERIRSGEKHEDDVSKSFPFLGSEDGDYSPVPDVPRRRLFVSVQSHKIPLEEVDGSPKKPLRLEVSTK